MSVTKKILCELQCAAFDLNQEGYEVVVNTTPVNVTISVFVPRDNDMPELIKRINSGLDKDGLNGVLSKLNSLSIIEVAA